MSEATLADHIDEIAERRGWFRPDDTKPFHNIVKSYMNGTTSLEVATRQIVDPINTAYTSADSGNAIREAEVFAAYQRQFWSPEEAEERWGLPLPEAMLPPQVEGAPTTEGMLWELWYSVLHMAKKTSWNDSDAQGRLVNLVKAMKDEPNPEPPVNMNKAMRKSWIWSFSAFWGDLNLLGASARESWNDSPGDAPNFKIFETAEIHAWTNINAFLARLTDADIRDYWIYAIWALREGVEGGRVHQEEQHQNAQATGRVRIGVPAAALLENVEGGSVCRKEHQNPPADTYLDAHVPAAAAWVILLGNAFFDREEDLTPKSYAEGNPAAPGYLLKERGGKPEFSKARWAFWKERFQGLSCKEGLQRSTKDIAAEAYTKMDECERLSKSQLV